MARWDSRCSPDAPVPAQHSTQGKSTPKVPQLVIELQNPTANISQLTKPFILDLWWFSPRFYLMWQLSQRGTHVGPTCQTVHVSTFFLTPLLSLPPLSHFCVQASSWPKGGEKTAGAMRERRRASVASGGRRRGSRPPRRVGRRPAAGKLRAHAISSSFRSN
jgi:hypothetical protein